MKKLGDHTSAIGVKREFYADAEGNLVEKIAAKDVSDVLDSNHEQAMEFRPHQDGGVRQVAEIPVELMLKWLTEEGIPGWCDHEAMDMLINKKLRDPQYQYLLTVPTSYRMMRYGTA